MPDLPPALLEFLVSKFSSIEQVDVFLLLYRTAPRPWSVAEVAQELRMAPQSAEMRLFLLTSAGLLAASDSPSLTCRYEPAPSLGMLAKAMSEVYDADRSAMKAVLEGAAPGASARAFADAFRLRKP